MKLACINTERLNVEMGYRCGDGRGKPGEGEEIIAGLAGSETTGELVIWPEDRENK